MSTASLPVWGECPTHGRTLHGSLSGDCLDCETALEALDIADGETPTPAVAAHPLEGLEPGWDVGLYDPEDE
jgi:xanthine/CO dehydrogenase XdhC/CoxF family maturation factor